MVHRVAKLPDQSGAWVRRDVTCLHARALSRIHPHRRLGAAAESECCFPKMTPTPLSNNRHRSRLASRHCRLHRHPIAKLARTIGRVPALTHQPFETMLLRRLKELLAAIEGVQQVQVGYEQPLKSCRRSMS